MFQRPGELSEAKAPVAKPAWGRQAVWLGDHDAPRAMAQVFLIRGQAVVLVQEEDLGMYSPSISNTFICRCYAADGLAWVQFLAQAVYFGK